MAQFFLPGEGYRSLSIQSALNVPGELKGMASPSVSEALHRLPRIWDLCEPGRADQLLPVCPILSGDRMKTSLF